MQRIGVQEWIAAFLEAAGPLSILAAQAVYLGQPLLRNALPAGQLDALASLLEDTEQRQAFINLLRRDNLLEPN